MAVTQTTTTDTALPSGKQIYDGLMSRINPELMTASLETLKEKYASETPAAKASRMKQYEGDFAEYEKQFAALQMDMQSFAQTQRRHALREAEHKEREQEGTALDGLLTQMQTA